MKEKNNQSKETTFFSIPTANDQRSSVLNPTSSSFKASNDNRSRQLNPHDSVYHSSRRGSRKK